MRIHSLTFGLLVLSIGCGSRVGGVEVSDGGADSTPDSAVVPPPDRDADPPVDIPPPVPSSEVDLLFVVDNSISMADKQREIARAVPRMIGDLTDPSAGRFATSLHVGVITSSLGSHGTSACAVELTSKANNDQGHLLPRAGEGSGAGCPAPVAASPISWTYAPGSDATAAATATGCVIQSAKEQGCGYEETLEAMYHFLVDPAPYAKAEVRCTFGVAGDACGSNKINIEGVDSELLAQRAAFLRPSSNVVIVVVSDENDFSLKPAGLNWLPWGYGKGQMQRGWSSCASVPDDFEPETPADFARLHDVYKCWSCFERADDANCTAAWSRDSLNKDVDGRSLRGFGQTMRFGYNFLWGRERYVNALTSKSVLGSDNKLAPNPLFAGGRSAGNVLFATIVGVPSRLVNTSDGLPKKSLSAADWDRIVGPIGVRDPHMIESIAPRAGVPKYAGDPSIDAINGGDRDILDGDDLQYACIAPRSTTMGNYDCDGPEAWKRNPLCAADGTQTSYKAYPGLRHLRVARALNGFVGSICDADLSITLQSLAARVRPMLK